MIGAGGTVAGSTTLTIPAGGFVSQVVGKLVAASGQASGAILVDSDQPLAAAGVLAVNPPLGDIAAIVAQPR